MTKIDAKHANSSRPDDLPSIVGRLAGVIGHESFPTGDRAALRRVTPAQPIKLAFYRFAFRHLPQGWEYRKEAWLTLVGGISIMSPGAHRIDVPAGRALAESGYSEARLERLLATNDHTLHSLVLRAARFLAAKTKPLNWIDMAYLLLSSKEDALENARLRIAKDFYQSQETQE